MLRIGHQCLPSAPGHPGCGNQGHRCRRAARRLRTGTPIDDRGSVRRRDFEAVLLCTGAHRDLRLNIPGEDASGCVGAVEMLRGLHTGEHAERRRPGGRHRRRQFRHRRGPGRRPAGRGKRHDLLSPGTRATCRPVPSEIREAEEEGVEIEFRVAPGADRRRRTERSRASNSSAWSMGKPDESGRRRPEPIAGSRVH